MNKKIWRSCVFVVTIVLIYFAFPIFLVPSSLPAIQQMFVENEFPDDSEVFVYQSDMEADVEIYELDIPRLPTAKDKVNLLIDLHKQGVDKILKR